MSAWGYAWLAAGPWTRIRVSARVHPCVGKMRPWGSGAWRVCVCVGGGVNAEKRRVHVPYAVGAPHREQRVSSDVPGLSFGFPAQGAGGYAPLVAVQRGPAGLPGRGSTCPARGACPGRA